MKLRMLYIALAFLLGVFWPLASSAETKVYRIAYISAGSPDSRSAFVDAFREALRQFGYVEGRNLVIDTNGATRPTRASSRWQPMRSKTNPMYC